MITASIAAIIIREEIEAIILIVLSIIGEILEDLAHDKTEKNIATMHKITACFFSKRCDIFSPLSCLLNDKYFNVICA